jgi:putative phosphoesterase
VAALFDVHGNLPALEAALAEPDAAAADLVVCGGDTVIGPFPRECLELLWNLGDRLVMIHGNCERYVLAPDEPGLVWQAEQLGPGRLARIAELPDTVTLEIDGLGAVLVCHGGPASDMTIVTLVTPDGRLARILEGVEADVVVAGHTHSQIDRTLGAIRWVNAGSVGMPYESEQGAYWALLGPDVELRRTPYDAEAAAERIRASDFPDAESFVADYVLSQHTAEEAAEEFEARALAQEANSEK